MALVYNLVLLLASPLLLLYLGYRLVVLGKSREGFAQRLGWLPALGTPPASGRVWLHAVSAGEVVAAAAIIRRLRELDPEIEVVLTTTTPAGHQQGRKLVPEARVHGYFPFDFLPCVLLALLRIRPTVVAPVETEIWPNWLWTARLLGIRRALVNGQFADRGYRGACRARPLYRWALGQFDALWMQSRLAAERAASLGAPADLVRATGNAKFEQRVQPLKAETAVVLSNLLELGSGRPLLVAGSTHPGEEEQVLDAFALARREIPTLGLLLAPRHVERSADVLALVRQRGFRTALRSRGSEHPVDVVVLDTMGELAGAYSLGQVAFIGGSLAPIGGHDLLQPLFHGRPVLFGPHTHNQRDLAALAIAGGAAVCVEDAEVLAEWIIRLCASGALRVRYREAAARLLAENTGAARAYAELLARLARINWKPTSEPLSQAGSEGACAP